MELKDLVGKHQMLEAARPDARHPFDTDKEGIVWCLDTPGIGSRIFMAFEDQNDGYRSCMGALFVAHASAYELWPSPEYIRRDVVARHVTRGDFNSEADILEIIDAETGHCWLRVGTDNIDDYYPSFIAVWTPMPPK